MPVRSWRIHLGRFAVAISLLLLAAWLSGYFLATLLAGSLACITWHGYNLLRLNRWLHHPDLPVPTSQGVWGDTFDSLNQASRQSRDQREQYRLMIREFQDLTNAFPDATLVVDENGAISWCNQAAESVLGLQLATDLGQNVTNFVRNPEFSTWLGNPLRSPSLDLNAPGDDSRWLRVSLVPFQNRQQLLIFRDVTDIHNVEQLRRDFVANISHELRTPVTVILGYLELLHDHPANEVAEAVKRMQGQTLQMRALLDDLLELSRLQNDQAEGEEHEVDMAAMLDQLKEQAEELSRGQHQLQFSVQPGLQLLGIPADLASAFRNLISNAIRYTPEGGRIEVRWEDSGDGPRLVVRDNGIGIPRKHIPRLTERFYRVSPDRARQTGGTGLGLAIVKHVLNAHQARLQIRSELGEGSEFSCVFPPARRVESQMELQGLAKVDRG